MTNPVAASVREAATVPITAGWRPGLLGGFPFFGGSAKAGLPLDVRTSYCFHVLRVAIIRQN